MKNRVAICKVILQVIFYLKRFEENGQKRPNVYLIGDKNEVLVSHTNELKKYLDEEIDWSVSPSTAWQVYPEVLQKLVDDEQINPFVQDIDEQFSF
jgi:rubrerythrin